MLDLVPEADQKPEIVRGVLVNWRSIVVQAAFKLLERPPFEPDIAA
jgi:hypothetical protein